MGSSCGGGGAAVLLACALSVVAGTVATLSAKAMYQTPASDGTKFSAPLTQAAIVALAMAANLFFAGIELLVRAVQRWRKARARIDGAGDTPMSMAAADSIVAPFVPPAAAEDDATHRSRSCAVSIVGIFVLALCDAATTVALVFAISLAPASVVQIIDSAGVVFVAFAARIFLGTRHSAVQGCGIAAACVGLACVGGSVALAGIEHGGRTTHESHGRGANGTAPAAPTSAWAATRSVAGAALALFAVVVSAAQWVLEERFLRVERRFTALQQVGLEGAIEAMLLICAVLPIAQRSGVEDVLASLRTLRQGGALLALACVFGFALMAYNPLSQTVAALSGSTLRVFMSALRSVFVWGGGFIVASVWGDGYGERWCPGGASWLQLLGFGLLAAGLVAFERGKKVTAERGGIQEQVGGGAQRSARECKQFTVISNY
jgi:drug/metabolite transporter (DMT)-like permease